ncbi:MerR family transcriptional regulator [Ktedonobacter racemifer]|uniref:Transcriptional regulator, MerR family n=1 Tax=Ktedonobacter racemifer DSM 44963 TaxID=485913 RepID=D6U6N1_KTERA|nr:MerR family transcriptional regulator [Ktedonobacter racemifer]EFH80642.1 transcriptional regulator, MerR family [Ktedonobacter racemifer DSM 44963]
MNEPREQLHTIGAVAKLTGVPIKTIRYYTDINLLPATDRTQARFRLYSTEAIWQLQLIRVLRQLAFSLEEIRAIIGGNLSVSTAIDWQLDAVAHQIHQLQRVQEVLQQAKETRHQPEQSIQTLYELALALSENVAERSRFVTEKLHALVEQANLPEEWRQHLLDHFTWQSPDTLTTEQIAAWTEVVSILNDPAFTEEALHLNSPTPNKSTRQMNIAEYNQQALILIQQAQSAALQGEPLESKSVQTLLRNWIRLIAASTQQAMTPAFVHKLSTQLSTSSSERMQRFWTLMALLSGREAPPSFQEGFDLLAAGLRFLISKPGALSTVLDDPSQEQ